MTMKGFDALYEDPQNKSGRTTPLPGTDAYLTFVAEKKRREKEKAIRESEMSFHMLSQQVLKAPVPPTVPPQSTGILEGTVPTRIPVTPTIPVDDDEVEITQNFMRFDLGIFELLPTLSEGEIRIYLDFIRRSYGQSPPRNTCFITRRKMGDTAGVTSPNAQVTIIQRLEQKGLIRRISTAQGKHQASKFRVFLPYETLSTTSNSAIRYPSSNSSS